MTPLVEVLLLAGYAWLAALLTWRLFPPWGTPAQTLVARTCLAFGATVGLASAGFAAGLLGFTAWDPVLFAWGPVHGIRQLCEALALISLLVGAHQALPAPARGRLPAQEGPRCPAVLRAAAIAIAAMTAVGFVATTWGEPHGGYDAISMWNMRARTLALSNGQTVHWWSQAFEPSLCRPNLDYPLLLGAWNARLMLVTGVNVAAPIATAAAFLAGVAALCGATAGAAGGAWRGCLAIIVVLGWDAVGDVGAKQMADVQVAFYILAATVCLWRGLRDGGSPGLLVLAGLATGCAAWTKNEGLLYGIAVGLASSLVLVRRGAAAWAHAAAAIAFGAAPFAAVLIVFKALWAPANDIVAATRTDEILTHLADPHRYLVVLGGLLRETAQMGKGIAVLFIISIVLTRALGGAPATCAVGPRAVGVGSGRRVAASALALTVALYLIPYVITRHAQQEHISNSMFRLILHLWPAAVVFGVLAIGAPAPRSGRR